MEARPRLDQRSSGVLLHPTSLPGPFGAGDLGPAAYEFADFLHAAGQTWWQMLPVGPPGAGDSPYSSPSSFAGSPWLVSLELLTERGLLDARSLAPPPEFKNAPRALLGESIAFREHHLRRAFETFERDATADQKGAFDRFSAENAGWLFDYAVFTSLRRSRAQSQWTTWEPELRSHEASAVERAAEILKEEVRYEQFLQYEFFQQWTRLSQYCARRSIGLIGDLPMFVAHDGSDVWARQEFFQLDDQGQPEVVAGVPPDAFSSEGQLWGNPLYRWDALHRTGFSWLMERFRATLRRFSAVRLDHFIGLYRYWEVPAHATTARDGRFVLVPGYELLRQVEHEFGRLSFIAEDLGLVTPEVEELRDHFSLPGMRVLQFAFGEEDSAYQPHRYPRRTVVYTGTHDNNTLSGWLNERAPQDDERRAAEMRNERERARFYAGSDGREFHWDLIRIALMSVADLAVFPMQDLLGLGAEARMNIPGTASGNWTFRLKSDQLEPQIADRMQRLCRAYGRVSAR